MAEQESRQQEGENPEEGKHSTKEAHERRAHGWDGKVKESAEHT